MQIQIYPDILFLIFSCGNSLEASQKRASNEYLECIFVEKLEIPVLFGKKKKIFHLEKLCT